MASMIIARTAELANFSASEPREGARHATTQLVGELAARRARASNHRRAADALHRTVLPTSSVSATTEEATLVHAEVGDGPRNAGRDARPVV